MQASGNVAFAGHQAGGGVQADPAGAGQVHLAPGVQVGEVDFGAAGAVQGLHVGLELNQVARHEARGQAAVAQQLHQQPARVAAGTAGQLQGFFGRLHAGLHADQVLDVLAEHVVQLDQENHRAPLGAVDLVQVGLDQRRHGLGRQVGGQLFFQLGVVGERKLFGVGLQEEVKRVVHGHFEHRVDRDLEFADLFREHQAGLVVGERILLPVDEMASRLDLERVRDDLGAAVRRRAQPDDLRTQVDQAVVFVVGDVAQGGVNGHGFPSFLVVNNGCRLAFAACEQSSKSHAKG